MLKTIAIKRLHQNYPGLWEDDLNPDDIHDRLHQWSPTELDQALSAGLATSQIIEWDRDIYSAQEVINLIDSGFIDENRFIKCENLAHDLYHEMVRFDDYYFALWDVDRALPIIQMIDDECPLDRNPHLDYKTEKIAKSMIIKAFKLTKE